MSVVEHGPESEAADRSQIRDLLQDWVVWRDAGDWERFRTTLSTGQRVMLFLAVFTAFAYLLKKEYWKDVH